MNSFDREKKLMISKDEAEKQFKMIYFDKLMLLAVEKCLRANKEFCRSHNYDTEHAQAEIIDLRNKHVEACYDKIFAFHKIYDEELSIFKKIN
jgi:hypothetical protein